MSFRFRGDFAELGRWSDKLVKAPELLGDISKNLAEETLELVREGFEQERDPDGKRWAPLESREGKIIQDTGALRNGFHRKALSRTSFTIGPSVDYGTYHQTGTSRGLPARRMVPDRGLPAKWRKRLADVANEILKRAFK